MKSRTHARVLTVVVLALVFFSGALVGRAWDETVTQATLEPVAEEQEEGGEERRRTPMYEQVGLSDTQLVQVDSIVVHYRNDVRALQKESREEYDRRYSMLVDQVRTDIKSVMSADQRAAYDSLLDQYEERRREWRERRREEGNEDGNGDNQ